jgi:hypothetical protein
MIYLNPQFSRQEIYSEDDANFSILADIQEITDKNYRVLVDKAKKTAYPYNVLIINEAIHMAPQNPEAYFVKADILDKNNRISEAIKQASYGNLLKDTQTVLQNTYPVKVPGKENQSFPLKELLRMYK